jgi:glycosyltransferase involved in cell wall biosynthesis
MATSLPCVVTRVGSNPDLVEEGRTGFLAGARDPETMAQRITELAANPQLRCEMGLQGRRKVESHFNLSAMVESYSRLYTSVAKKQDVVAGKWASEQEELGN